MTELLAPSVLGYRFEAQVLVRGYVVDFLCRSLRLAIEVDGSSHRDRAESDEFRDQVLAANERIKIIRVRASDVMNGPSLVVSEVRSAVQARLRELRRAQLPRLIPPQQSKYDIPCRHGRPPLLCGTCRRVEALVMQKRAKPTENRPSGRVPARRTGVIPRQLPRLTPVQRTNRFSLPSAPGSIASTSL